MPDTRLFVVCVLALILWLVGAMGCMVVWLVTGDKEWQIRGVLMFLGYLMGKMAQLLKQEEE